MVDCYKVSADKLKVHVLEAIILSKDVVKLGYGIKEDVVSIIKAAGATQPVEEDGDPVREKQKAKLKYTTNEWIDLRVLHGELINPRGTNLGLKDLTSSLLGCTMKKELQCSSWGDRPLQEAQLDYAALDAACLLDLWDKMLERLISKDKASYLSALDCAAYIQNLRFEMFKLRRGTGKQQNYGGGTGGRGKGKGKRNHHTRRNKGSPGRGNVEYQEECHIPNSLKMKVSTWFNKNEKRKFICDEMLEGLAKQLRSCGIDTEVAVRSQDYEEQIDLKSRQIQALKSQGMSIVEEVREFKQWTRQLLVKAECRNGAQHSEC